MASGLLGRVDALLMRRICRVNFWPQRRIQQVVQTPFALFSSARSVDECTEFVDLAGVEDAPGADESGFVELEDLRTVKKIVVHSQIL